MVIGAVGLVRPDTVNIFSREMSAASAGSLLGQPCLFFKELFIDLLEVEGLAH